jgi:hypothetical protein
MGFATRQHIKDRRSTHRGCYLPATFRPRGLVTPSTVYSLRTPAGSVSHRRRSWVSPFEAFPFRKVSRFLPNLEAPTYRSTSHCSRRVDDQVNTTPSRTAKPRFLGFDPHGSPWRSRMRLGTTTTGCFPGLCPSEGLPTEALRGISPAAPLTRLAASTTRADSDTRLRVSINFCLTPPADNSLARITARRTTLSGFLRQCLPLR